MSKTSALDPAQNSANDDGYETGEPSAFVEKPIPRKLRGLMACMTVIDEKLKTQKEVLNDLTKALKTVNKEIEKLINKEVKTHKPSGFELLTNISDEMCAFMDVEKGTMMPRVEVTRFINNYIKANNLQNPANKRQINPDDKLKELLGSDAEGVELDYFGIQKYLSKHFIYTKNEGENTPRTSGKQKKEKMEKKKEKVEKKEEKDKKEKEKDKKENKDKKEKKDKKETKETR